MDRTLVYTTCNEPYYMFIPIFTLSVLMHNEDADVEIGIDSKGLDSRTMKAIGIIGDVYGRDRIRIDYEVFSPLTGNKAMCNGRQTIFHAVRFITEPVIRDTYTYISDIDIVCLENISKPHIEDMKKHHSDYSNMMRDKDDRMSGLHFTKSSVYYPLPDLSDIDLARNDEQILHDIVAKRCEVDMSRKYRPVHGIHMSMSRSIGPMPGKPSWGASPWKAKWIEFEKDSVYRDIYPYFDVFLKNKLDELNEYYTTIK